MKNKIITTTFLCLLGGLLLVNILSPSKNLSYSERRKLAQFPKVTVGRILNGGLMKDFDDYAVD